MLDVIGLLYFTISNLYLLGSFPIYIFEFLDLRTGYAVSDYALLFEVGTYFNVSAIITGLLCGLDAITNLKYKRIRKSLYNIHAIAAFSLVGIGIFPLTGAVVDTNKVLHWIFALTFILIYPLTRIFVLRYFNKKLFKKLLILYIGLNIAALGVYMYVSIRYIAYPEYLMWLNLLAVIILSQIAISKKKKE